MMFLKRVTAVSDSEECVTIKWSRPVKWLRPSRRCRLTLDPTPSGKILVPRALFLMRSKTSVSASM